MSITFVSIGTGEVGNLTIRAHESLTTADRVYVMARPDSWVFKFVCDLAGEGKVRRYLPQALSWAMWRDDPVFAEIADELAAGDRAGENLAVAVSGDFSLYSEGGPLTALLRRRNLAWQVLPGVSFLGAVATKIGEPLTFEGDILLVIGSDDLSNLERGLGLADTIVVYHPSGMAGLAELVRSAPLASAHSVEAGVAGRPGSVTDLRSGADGSRYGVVVLRTGRDAKEA